MESYLYESPLVVGIAGCAMAIVAGLFWTQTGDKIALYSAIGLAAITVLLVGVNVQVQTDREKIRVIMDEVADAVRKNDHDKVFTYMHPNSIEGLRRAKAELPGFEFSQARITRVKSIDVNPDTTPPTAIAEFNVFVEVKMSGQNFKVPRFVRAYFMDRDGKWLVKDYEHFEPTAGFRNTDF